MVNFRDVWKEQCDAARQIQAEFGTEKALDYLIGGIFLNFLEAAERLPDFRAEVPAFVAEIKTMFEPSQLAEALKTARQTKLFHPHATERQSKSSRSASDLLLIDRARKLLLRDGNLPSTGSS